MNELIRQKTGINIQTHTWLTKEEVACPGFICKILYYWTGLLNNEIHKFKYLTLKAKLGILKTQIIAMVSDLYAEVMTSMQIPRTEEEMKEFKSQSQYRGNEIERVDENRSDSPVPSWKFDYDDIIINFRVLDSLLLEYYGLIWNTRAPMNKFLDTYIEKRNRACYIEPRIPYTDTKNKLKKRMDDLNCMITEFEVMTDFIRLSIDANDGMLFKIIILFLNVLTVLGEFVWNRYYSD